VSFDASLLVMMGLFWVTYLILRIFFFKPMMEVLEKRRTTLETAQSTWDAAAAEANEKIEHEKARLSEARSQAMSAREQERREAQARRSQQLAEAKDRVQQTLAAAAADLEKTVGEQRQSLEADARRLADDIATNLLGRTA
jgi:F-type H+-transporting ATPase subunit b